MTNINLLPWRAQLRQQEKKRFIVMLLIALVSTLILITTVNCHAKNLAKNQQVRNQLLQNELAVFDKQIKEIKSIKHNQQELTERMALIQNLQSTRVLLIHFFDELSNMMPAEIYLTRLRREHDLVSLWGYSESNSTISKLMRSIEQNQYMNAPELSEIKKVKEDEHEIASEFKLNFTLKSQSATGAGYE